MVTVDRDHLLISALAALNLHDAVLESSETRATDTLVWRVNHRGRSLAIRVLREEQRPVMQIERQAMEIARAAGVPAPEVISTGFIDDALPAMAIEWIKGETVGDTLLRQPRLATRLAIASGQMLAEMHQLVPERTNIPSDWIARGATRDPELFIRLDELASKRHSLLHLDFHPFNLISLGGRIVGVLDWTNAAIGDPRADVARTVSTMQLVAPLFIGERGSHRMTSGLFARGFLRGYQRAGGPLSQMAPFYAWAGNLLLDDLTPKLDTLPMSDPDRFTQRVTRWTDVWRSRAGID